MKENRAIGEEARNPITCGKVNPERSKGRNQNPWLEMVEEMGEVEKKDPTDAIGGNGITRLSAQESGGIGGGEKFAGAELSGTQDVEAKVKSAQVRGNNLLEEFAMTFEERNGAVGFSK